MRYFQKRGKSEDDFALLLDNLVWSTSKQDVTEHWDMQGVLRDVTTETYKFDVKSMKKSSRSDSKPDPDIAWIESRNVRGDPGWVHGGADYIAFEQPHVWVVVHRLKLLEFMRKKIDSTVEDGASFVSSPEDALYRLYQRKGQRDVISKAKMSDILAIAMWEVPKFTPQTR
tara:strand:- start:96 stop:608 length:513 start_codon:yes stop_codon:yes gene_type:complete